MIRIALCDDDSTILSAVTLYIQKYAEKKKLLNLEIFPFETARALRNALDEAKSFDIFLLDVYIGDELGTALAKNIRKRGIESPIVFLTTSLEHAPESFETGTLRYLLKPLNPQKLFEALDVALQAAEKTGQHQIKLKTENGVENINTSRILYSEAHDHYQYITLECGSQIRVRMTVTELYQILARSGGFFRVGSSYIVNLRNIRNVTTSQAHLYGNVTIPIPRGKHTELKKAFWNFQCDGQED